MGDDHLRRIGSEISVPIPADDEGFTGRECPGEECLGYFKVMFGTGLDGITTCICPYCGTKEEHDHFWTPDQIEYAQSAAMRQISEAVTKDFKAMEFEVKPPRNALFGIGMSMKVKAGPLPPLHRYAEPTLETRVECTRCSHRYAIYGVFGHCPDCGSHNNLGILEANLALVEKMVAMAADVDDQGLSEKLVENALEDCVSVFDGWGRAAAAAHASQASDATKAQKLSFQNLRRAQERVLALFGHDFASAVTSEEFTVAHGVFQKRHLVAHKMGVVDQAYVDATADDSIPVGRKVPVEPAEISEVLLILRQLARGFVEHLEAAGSGHTEAT